MENNLFVYGILQRGFELDLSDRGAKFLGEAELPCGKLYGIGHNWDGESWNGVGLRFTKDPFKVAHGELFEIPEELWPWLDEIEQNGHCYTRRQVMVHLKRLDVDTMPVLAWAYEHTFPGMIYDRKNEILSGRFENRN